MAGLSATGRLRDELSDKNAEIDALKLQVKLLRETQGPNGVQGDAPDIKELLLAKQKLSAEIEQMKFELEQERANNAKNKRHIRDLNATIERCRSSSSQLPPTSSSHTNIPSSTSTQNTISPELLSQISQLSSTISTALTDSPLLKNIPASPMIDLGTPTPPTSPQPPLSPPPTTPLPSVSTLQNVTHPLTVATNTPSAQPSPALKQPPTLAPTTPMNDALLEAQRKCQKLEQDMQHLQTQYELQTNSLNSQSALCVEQLRNVQTTLSARELLLDQTTASLKATNSALENAKHQLSSCLEELERVKAELVPKEQLESRLRVMEVDREALEKQLESAQLQQKQLTAELTEAQTNIATLTEQNEQFNAEVVGLRSKLEETHTMVQSTRSKKDLSRDKDFHDRFPDLPATELLIEYYYCSYGKTLGYLYLSQNYVCFESMTGGSRCMFPLKSILSVNQAKGLIPGKSALQISLDDTKVHGFFGLSNVSRIIKTIVVQGRNGSHIIIPLKDGKEVDISTLIDAP
ncbi:hypothetical protein Pelo_6894 [Pelomyxa schiedti]|nr:hypothetical protein Pelo_6894 [Pelomyxa schiedti]